MFVFGSARRPLRVEDTSRQTLSISGIVLCNQVQASPDGQEAAARAPQYVPLSGNGVEFSPAADARFARGEHLFSFFEIYLPPDDRASITETMFQVRLINVESGELQLDTGIRPMGSGSLAVTGIVPISGEISIGNLLPGRYRLNVQASDSTGARTAWRESCFVIR